MDNSLPGVLFHNTVCCCQRHSNLLMPHLKSPGQHFATEESSALANMHTFNSSHSYWSMCPCTVHGSHGKQVTKCVEKPLGVLSPQDLGQISFTFLNSLPFFICSRELNSKEVTHHHVCWYYSTLRIGGTCTLYIAGRDFVLKLVRKRIWFFFCFQYNL